MSPTIFGIITKKGNGAKNYAPTITIVGAQYPYQGSAARKPASLQLFGLHVSDFTVTHDDQFTVLLLHSLFQALLGKEYPGIYFLLHLLNLDLTHKV